MRVMRVMKAAQELAGRFARWDESEGALGRHAALLASLVVLLVALPVVRLVYGGDVRFSILMAAVLLAAVFVNSPQRWSFHTALVIAGSAIVSLGFAAATDSLVARVVADASSLALLGFTTLLMLNSLIYARRVSPDTIVGGICVYLLIGLCFAVAFRLLCDFEPGAIVEGEVALRRSAAEESPHAAKLLYYSFVTLTTLGYGDIRPRSELAQMMAVAEAVIGQLYLAIFVARLVALYVHDGQRPGRLDSGDSAVRAGDGQGTAQDGSG